MNKIDYTTHYAQSKKNFILIFSNLDNLTLSGIYTGDLFEYIKISVTQCDNSKFNCSN